MRAAAVTLALALALVPLGASAQSHQDSEPQAVALTQTVRANFARARAALDRHVEGLSRCVESARATDPAPLARVSRLEVIVRMRANGAARAVEVSPSYLPQGLSSCLATELFSWRMTGRVGPRALVRIRVGLTSPRGG